MKRIAFAFVFAALTACGGGDDPAPAPTDNNAIQTNEIRLTVTAMPSAITATDKFSIAGNFKAEAESWKPAGSAKYELVKSADGKTWSVDIPLSALPAAGDFEYKVVRNATASGNDGWKFGEKNATCGEIDNRKVTSASTQGGKEFKFAVDNFRNTGTCPD
jgi:hypothetical protein